MRLFEDVADARARYSAIFLRSWASHRVWVGGQREARLHDCYTFRPILEMSLQQVSSCTTILPW
jgi:hypothetical protein